MGLVLVFLFVFPLLGFLANIATVKLDTKIQELDRIAAEKQKGVDYE